MPPVLYILPSPRLVRQVVLQLRYHLDVPSYIILTTKTSLWLNAHASIYWLDFTSR